MTRPRIASGATTCTSVERMTTLSMSAAPRIGKRRERQHEVARQAEDERRRAIDRHRDHHAAPDMALRRAPRQHQAGHERAQRRRAAQQAEPGRADAQDVAREDRHQRGGAAEKYAEEVQRDGAAHCLGAPDEAYAAEDARATTAARRPRGAAPAGRWRAASAPPCSSAAHRNGTAGPSEIEESAQRRPQDHRRLRGERVLRRAPRERAVPPPAPAATTASPAGRRRGPRHRRR